jgi:putative ABC transport system permease protein
MTIFLRLLAAVLVRGPDAQYIRQDLEEMHARDRARGMSACRAHLRCAYYLLGSAFSVWRDRLRWPRLAGVQWLDVKLAGRMLIRYPGLTLVGGLALAIRIPIALAPVQLANAINAPLPFDEADRIVALEYWDRADSRRATLHDYERWKSELTSFEALAAARRRIENIIGEGGMVDIVRGAEMTASAFAVPRVQPLFGRTLVEADEAKGAEPVVVIGYDLWQRHFGGASDVLGRTLHFGRTVRVVVGVMPEGFLFPSHDSFWVPLQARAIDYAFGQGPRYWVFGRLREGVSSEQTQAEFTAIGRRLAADHPETHANLRADVLPYQHAISGLKPTFDRVYVLYFMSLSLLAVACGNVGTLMLARTAARSSEIAVRNALGAGRGRIVMQLFIESLLLAMLAAAVGLVVADLVVSQLPVLRRLEAVMPFWVDFRVKPSTVAVAGGFAVFCALIAGLLPALKATGKRAYGSLQRLGSGGSGLRFGAAATVLIVAEVAIAVGGLSGVASVARGAFGERSFGEGIVAQEYLTTELRLPVDFGNLADPSSTQLAARLAAIENEVSRRLMAEPGVRAASFASELPGMRHGRRQVEVEGADASRTSSRKHIVNLANVDRGFFDALGQGALLGRTFEARDLAPGGGPVVVNRSFVDKVLQGVPPVGRRIRYVRAQDQAAAPWHEIIGVVNDLGMNVVDPEKGAGVYHVVAPGQIQAPQLLVRIAGDAATFVPRLRAMLIAIEPTMVLDNPVRLDHVFSEMLLQAQFSAAVFALIAVIAVGLSAAGLYALMAFAVSQRTREIAIRTALGARPLRVVSIVVSRALLQLVVGVALGVGLAAMVIPEVMNSFTMADNWRLMLAAVSIAMILIGLLACVVPTRRALRIEPVEALKELG